MPGKNPDYLPLVDENGIVTGKELRSVCHNGKSMLLHPVVHLHLFNESGELYLQKRPVHKDVQPGRWDTAVGGHVDPGETTEEALVREAREELNIDVISPVKVTSYIWESTVERELVSSWLLVTNLLPDPDPSEVDEGRFWTVGEIEENIGKGLFTPNFEQEFIQIIDFLKKTGKRK